MNFGDDYDIIRDSVRAFGKALNDLNGERDPDSCPWRDVSPSQDEISSLVIDLNAMSSNDVMDKYFS